MESPECRANYLRQPSMLHAESRGNGRTLQNLEEMSELRPAHGGCWRIKTQIKAISWKHIHHEMLKVHQLFCSALQCARMLLLSHAIFTWAFLHVSCILMTAECHVACANAVSFPPPASCSLGTGKKKSLYRKEVGRELIFQSCR